MLEICEVQVFGMSFFFYLNACSCKLLTCILLSSISEICLCVCVIIFDKGTYFHYLNENVSSFTCKMQFI